MRLESSLAFVAACRSSSNSIETASRHRPERAAHVPVAGTPAPETTGRKLFVDGGFAYVGAFGVFRR